MSSVPKNPTVALATLSAGERVEVSLRSPDPSQYQVWHGAIVAVDAIGLRICAKQLRTDYGRFDEDGNHFFPWSAIESVEVKGEARVPA